MDCTKWIERKKLDENRLDENWAHGCTLYSAQCTLYSAHLFLEENTEHRTEKNLYKNVAYEILISMI